jgi:diguanylate cyclase (GGDEF)-like protein
MTVHNRTLQYLFLLAAAGVVLLFAAIGHLKPVSDWRGIDLLGEGGTALMAAGWMRIVLGSRPAGRVTLLLALGLAGVALGAWADTLDEVFAMHDAPWRVDKWIESGLTPLGMLLLTLGLMDWRREQFQLSEHMQQRERLFREHRDFDRITQLASTDYLREQIALEQERNAGVSSALLMLEIADLQSLVRTHGRRDGVRALQAVTHQLLLNLRHDDLLCRHAGDRFLVLLPKTSLADAQRSADHLARMVGATRFHTLQGERVELGLRSACIAATDDAKELLSRMNRMLEDPSAGTRPQPA